MCFQLPSPIVFKVSRLPRHVSTVGKCRIWLENVENVPHQKINPLLNGWPPQDICKFSKFSHLRKCHLVLLLLLLLLLSASLEQPCRKVMVTLIPLLSFGGYLGRLVGIMFPYMYVLSSVFVSFSVTFVNKRTIHCCFDRALEYYYYYYL